MSAGELLSIDMPDEVGIEARFAWLTAPLYVEQLLDQVGELVEHQTKHRLEDEKTAPSGEAWPAWSPAYDAAVKREGNEHHTMLVGKIPTRKDPGTGGDLLLSIVHLVHVGLGESEVEVGSNLPWAAAHQYGTETIPRRQYLGLSDDNERELDTLVHDYMETIL